MIFEQIAVGNMQNFSYLIADEKSKEAAIVDPGWDIEKLLSIAQKLNLKISHILITHSHYDHMQECKNIQEKTGAIIYVHKNDADEIRKLGIDNIKELNDEDEIHMGELKFYVIHTPGHTPGSVCYQVENKLITGDMLFVGNIGRTDLPGGDPRLMTDSLRKMKLLDEKIQVWPGHDYGLRKYSTIGEEKKKNPHMLMID
jgi:hydroxyacylglutathione hydrolase